MSGVWTLDGDISEKLRSLLSDPEAVARISAIAGGLSGASSPAPPGEAEGNERTDASASSALGALPALSGATDAARDPRVALLYSLKPLLRQEKQSKVDDLARALAVVTLFKNTRK